MICFDRMVAIFFPMKIINYGYKSAIISSLIMFLLCLIFTIPYFVHVRSIKVGLKFVCIISKGKYLSAKEFLQMWRLLFLFIRAFPIGLIILINISLLFNIVNRRKQMKIFKTNIKATSKKELKATTLVLILTIFFLIGTITNASIYFMIVNLEMLTYYDSIVKNRLQNLSNIAEISTIITLLMESINIFIYYIKIKKFRVQCNKMIRFNL